MPGWKSVDVLLQDWPRFWSKDSYQVEAVRTAFTGNWDQVLIELGLIFRRLEGNGKFAMQLIGGFTDCVLDEDCVKDAMDSVGEKLGRTRREVHQILLVAVTGRLHGLSTFDNLRLLGPDKACRRCLEAVMAFKYPTCPVCHAPIEMIELNNPAEQYSWLGNIMYRFVGEQTVFGPCGRPSGSLFVWYDCYLRLVARHNSRKVGT